MSRVAQALDAWVDGLAVFEVAIDVLLGLLDSNGARMTRERNVR